MLKKKFRKNVQKFDRIAFFGPMCAGKTYAANYLVENRGYKRIGFADKLKSLSYELFGTNGKDGKNRIIYQKVGLAMREIDPNVWVNYLEYYIHKNEGEKLVVDDLRFANEAKMLKANGFILILVSTSTEIRNKRIHHLYPNMPLEAQEHLSEQEWAQIKPDYTIDGESWNGLVSLDQILDSPW